APGVSSAAATAARVAQIKKDYEDMMTRFAAEFTAAGEHFPGGLNAYLRQLALLEREKWKDLSAILTPRELEDLQMQDTHAGQLTRECLANTAATDEQRRAVFRLQQEFDDKWALTFDLSAATLLARQTERQATQEKILALLGPDLFGAWLHGEGSDYALSVDWAARQGFAPDFALNEWRLKSEFELARLQLTVQAQAQRFSREEVEGREAELAQRMRERARAVFGPTVIEAAQGSGRFSWLR
ncbi:MAG TPA: hypothetical protein VHD62_16500, partial [Opitutaceae bacterium]|nr:hypothetical protein [Opitutaceae bacterium]